MTGEPTSTRGRIGIGRPILRREDRRLVTGEGRYIGSIEPEGMLHARFIRSDLAHGIMRDLDLDPARGQPGVVAALGARDVPGHIDILEGLNRRGWRRPLLASERVRFAGEPLAVVVAESERQAFDAADAVWPEIDELPTVVDPSRARQGDVLLHPDAGTNVVERFHVGNADEHDGPWAFDVEITVDVTNQRVAPVPIEPLTALAEPEGDTVTLWVGHQLPHQLKRMLEEILGFEIRVVVPDVGGSFGMKGRMYPEFAVLAVLARELDRPVRWLQTRRESMLTGTHGRDMRHHVRLAGDRDGRIRRVVMEVLASVGAYPQTGAQVPHYTALLAQEMYDIPELRMSVETVVTNVAPTAPYRGAGRPEAAHGMERAIDVFARELGLDPLDVRRRNLLPASVFPYTTHTGALYDSGDYRAALDRAAELLDVDHWRAEQDRRRRAHEDPIGIGFGAFVERAGGPPDSGEYAHVELREDGTLTVRTGSVSNGQGHETTWSQIVGEVFDVDLDRVSVLAGDTAAVRSGWGSVASRSAQIGGSAILRTSERLRDSVRQLAAEMLEVAPEDLVLQDGAYQVRGVPGTRTTLEDIAREASGRGQLLVEEELYSPGLQTFPYGVDAAVVRVEIETGHVEILKLVAVDDCGNAINPIIVDGQVHGSLAQGVGQALFEEVRYDERGQLLTATLMDYPIPHARDLPMFETDRIVSPAPSNPLGAKGAGESGCIGGPSAIVNAVVDALAPLGVTHIEMPLRPQTVWRAIHDASQ